MYQFVLLVHVLVALALIGLVIIQQGKGAEIGAAFGSGASNTVFGSQGTGGFLFRLTGILALTFFVTSLSLSYLISAEHEKAKALAIPVQEQQPVNSMPLPVEVPAEPPAKSR